MVENQKVVELWILIAQKKGFNALNTTQKTPALCKVPFLKKVGKTGKNVFFIFIYLFFFFYHFDHF